MWYTIAHFFVYIVILHQKLPEVRPPGGFRILIEDLCLVLVITGGGSGLFGWDFKSILDNCWLGAFSGWRDFAGAGGGISPPLTFKSSSFLITGW